MALLTGLVLVTTGGNVVVNLVVYGVFKPFPCMSVMLLECRMTVYLVPAFKSELGVIERILPTMFVVYGTIVPLLLVLNSIHGLVPSCMALSKVICITLFNATLNALYTGLVLVTTGAALL